MFDLAHIVVLLASANKGSGWNLLKYASVNLNFGRLKALYIKTEALKVRVTTK
jgi:hypothetical protein